MFLPNKNGENRHLNSSEMTKSGLPASRQDTWKKYVSQNRKSKTKSQKPQFFFPTFLLPVPGGRMHELVHSVLYKKVFFEVRRRDLSKPHGFGQKMPPLNLYLTVVYAIRMITP